MRQLKFRIWDAEYKRFLSGYRELNRRLLPSGSGYEVYNEKDREIWQQFTGLKDSLGVEIYEGDIVSYHFDNPEVFWNDLVAWGEAGWVFQNFDGTESGESRACEYKHLRVVGNIFENRELLDPAPKTL